MLSPLSGTSEVRNQFHEPQRVVYDQATTRRKCPAESDWDGLTKGVERVLSNVRSGRDFLQTFPMFWPRELQVGPYFEALASTRRLGMLAECSAWLRRRVEACRPAPLARFETLDSFDLYAGDGHFLGSALAFCAGTFLCIACADLLPELQFHAHDRMRPHWRCWRESASRC